MLVLSRTRDETIMIGDEIEITVVDVRGDKVRLGVNAPTSIPVHRKEVYEAIKRENSDASRLRPDEMTKVMEPRAENTRKQWSTRQSGQSKRPKNGSDRRDRSKNTAIKEDCS